MEPETQALLVCCGILLSGFIAGYFSRYIHEVIREQRRIEKRWRTSTAKRLLGENIKRI